MCRLACGLMTCRCQHQFPQFMWIFYLLPSFLHLFSLISINIASYSWLLVSSFSDSQLPDPYCRAWWSSCRTYPRCTGATRKWASSWLRPIGWNSPSLMRPTTTRDDEPKCCHTLSLPPPSMILMTLASLSRGLFFLQTKETGSWLIDVQCSIPTRGHLPFFLF